MNCHACRELLSAYMDGTLGANANIDVHAHLEICPRCRRVNGELARLNRLLRVASSPVPRRDFWPRTYAKLRQKAHKEMPVPEVFAHKGRDLAKPNSAARNGTRRYEYAVVTMVIATLLQMMASPLLLERLPYLFLLLGVAYTARRYGFGPALLSVGLGTLIADYFFIAPMFSFAIVTPQTALQIGSYIFLGFALALIMTAFRRSYPVRFTS